MLRDRIVVGIRDQALSQRLQTDPSPTLEKAKRAVRQKEAVHEQSNILQGDGTAKSPVVIDQVKGGKPAAAGGKAGAKQPPKTTKTSAGHQKEAGTGVNPVAKPCKRCDRSHQQ